LSVTDGVSGEDGARESIGWMLPEEGVKVVDLRVGFGNVMGITFVCALSVLVDGPFWVESLVLPVEADVPGSGSFVTDPDETKGTGASNGTVL
jgi:hypothetical protein